MAGRNFFPSSKTKAKRQMAEQAKQAQQQPKPQTTLNAKELIEKAGAEKVELKPKPEMVVSAEGERSIVYTETIRAEASFVGKNKSVLTIKQNREISVILEPEV